MTSALNLSDFSPELLHSLFCFCSQRDLTSLSRVNHAFRQTADYLLHRDITLSFQQFPDLPDSYSQMKRSIFRTLTSNPQKAALLRYFHVEFWSNGDQDVEHSNYPVLTQVVDALRSTHGLEDLRIIVRRPEYTGMSRPSDPSKGDLSKVIKSGYFQLHTLYCNCYQDLEGIIVSQKRLRLFGIYTNHYHSGYLKVSKLINNSRIDNNSNFPGIFMLFSPLTIISRLALFPELCPPGQTFTLCRDIATSFGRDLGKYDTIPPVDRHRNLEIHVFDFSHAKTDIICEVVDAMAQYFVKCEVFTVWVQTGIGIETVSNPWRISGILNSINQFKQLKRLEFYIPSNDGTRDWETLLNQEVRGVVGLKMVRVRLDC